MTEATKKEPVEEKNRPRWFVRIPAFFGIIVSLGKKHPVHLSKVFFVWIGVLVVLIVAANIGMYSYSTYPGFCNSCHIMKPYYNAWKTSGHFGKAVCVDCHYPPSKNLGEHLWHKFQATAQVVKYITRTYSSKPFAEVEDASCLRSGCHSTRLLEGRVVTKKRIKFDHGPHLTEVRRERKLRCVSCHSQIVVGRHVEVTYSTCYLCHFKDRGKGPGLKPIGGCLGCHDLPQKPIRLRNMTYNHKDFVTKRGVGCENCHVGIVSGEGAAPKDRCFTCHNQPEKLERYVDMPFIHENHVTKHNIACLHCHEEMQHGFQEQEGGVMPRLNEPPIPTSTITQEDHSATLVFDCSFCHENKHVGQLEMYSGKVGGFGLPEMPSPMFLADVDCIGCHYKETTDAKAQEFTGKTYKASEEACVKCHGPKFAGIWDETKTELQTTMIRMDEKIKAVQSAYDTAFATATLPTKDNDKLKKKLDEAGLWHNFVEASHGEHNIYLASAVLRRIDKNLSEAGTALNTTLPDLSALPLLSGGFCATLCHSKVGVKVPPETVKAFGKEMPHVNHTQMMGCVQCHDIGEHKKAPLKKDVKTEVCDGCHP